LVRIRLKRLGAKKRPFYRLVAADQRCARDGRFIEMLGYYDPTTEPTTINVKKDRVEYWLGCGAQPTDTARALLKVTGFFGGPTEKPARVKGKAKAKAAAQTAAAAAETPAATETAAAEAAPAESPAAETAVEDAPAAETAAEAAPVEGDA